MAKRLRLASQLSARFERLRKAATRADATLGVRGRACPGMDMYECDLCPACLSLLGNRLLGDEIMLLLPNNKHGAGCMSSHVLGHAPKQHVLQAGVSMSGN